MLTSWLIEIIQLVGRTDKLSFLGMERFVSASIV